MIKEKIMRYIGLPDWEHCQQFGYKKLIGIKPDYRIHWLDMKCQPSHKNYACKECEEIWSKKHEESKLPAWIPLEED